MSIFKKIMISPILLTFVFTIAFATFYWQISSIMKDMGEEVENSTSAVQQVYQESIHPMMRLVESISFDPLLSQEADELNRILYRLRQYPAVKTAYFVDFDERILGDGLDPDEIAHLGESIPPENHLTQDLSQPLFEIEANQLIYSHPFNDQGDHIGRLQVTFSLNAIHKIEQGLLQKVDDLAQRSAARFINIMLLAVLLILIALALSYFITRRISKDLFIAIDVAKEVAGGNWDIPIKTTSKDEIGVLFEAMRVMVDNTRSKINDLNILNQTGKNLAGLFEKTKALEEVFRVTQQKNKIERCSVYLMNEVGELEMEAYFPHGDQSKQTEGRKFRVGEGIVGVTAKLRQIQFIPNTAEANDFIKGNENSAKSLLCVPLMDDQKLFGVMNFSGDVDRVVFEKSDEGFVHTLAGMTVVNLKNIQMLNLIEEHNRTLESKVQERTTASRS
ncbi:MAG: hypothetical protein COB67_09215 [SAR324 cluster bacterium]|uniref:histidine kinase n=1 Tax=SAR324 cluster bacterium TaxID=2024889 RepID=A0A2A4T167_9DELT|nr:MAG: hypothetical protein COB67_09215 [SAR324 cluster bacterium]